MYTPRAVYAVHTHGDTPCTPGTHPLLSRSLSGCPAVPGGTACLWHSSPKPRAPLPCPAVRVGTAGAGWALEHGRPPVLCREQGQLSLPVGMHRAGRAGPVVRGRLSHIPCGTSCPGDTERPGPGTEFPPAGGSQGRERQKGTPGGTAPPRAGSLPSAGPSAAVTFCHGQRLPQARLARRLQAGPASAGCGPGTSAARDGTAESCRRVCGWPWPSDPVYTRGG